MFSAKNLNKFARDVTALITISLIIFLINFQVAIFLVVIFFGVLFLYFKFC